MSLFADGGLLALDWGQKKVGYATCDEDGRVVTPRGNFKRAKSSAAWRMNQNDEAILKKLLDVWQPGALVLGLPVSPGGEKTSASTKAEVLAESLSEKFNLKVILVNESLTSWDSRNAKDDDAMAASLLLEDLIAQKKRNSNGFVKWALLITLTCIALLGFATRGFFFQAHAPDQSGSYLIDVPPGTGFPQLFKQLGMGATNQKIAKVWLKAQRLEGSLKVGEFQVWPEWSIAKTLEHVLTAAPLYHSLTIKEGENIYDIYQTLSKVFEKLSYDEYMKIMRDPKLLQEMGVPTTEDTPRTLEGFLYPETYTYQKYHTPRDVIRHMLSYFDKFARPELAKHPNGKTPEGIFELLTLASIVEKESSSFEEQPVVASVFWNRIEKSMRLQSDPTTIYPLLPDFDGNIKKIHLESKNSYNTYRMNGLPIGPISNPSLSAIRAVVSPAETEYLFFVSKNDGTHIFSKDYETHSKYVRDYQILRKKSKEN
ncbi:endolytic transglycosylase MltG [bacterium]|nr:endolytic transglycosylase MltG [bacterium]